MRPTLFKQLTCFFLWLTALLVHAQPFQNINLSSNQSSLTTINYQTNILDSIAPLGELPKLEKPAKVSFFQHDAVRITFAPTILFAASAATWGSRKNIREIRNRYIPTFHHSYDDYTQYAPAIAVYGLKIGGVKGRNNLLRTALSHGTSLAIMGILVNSIKYTAKVERPDGSANNSFPSGHTAMAFTNATMMHKEYGIVHPIYSVAGYTAATFTALGRGMNNKHWISDVLAGAGVGILSTQLGYFFIDKIFKNDGDNMSILSKFSPSDNPSFLSIKLANATALTNLMRDFEVNAKSKIGFETGFEGAYFFNKHWGLGGDVSFTSFPINKADASHLEGEEDLFEAFDKSGRIDMITESIGTLNFALGPYYATELSKKWLLMAKAQLGVNFGAKGKITYEFETPQPLLGDKVDVLSHKPLGALRASTGGSITYKFNDEIGLAFYIDYHYTKPKVELAIVADAILENVGAPVMIVERQRLDYIATGLKLMAFF